MRFELDNIEFLGDVFFTNNAIFNNQDPSATTALQIGSSNIIIFNDNLTVDFQTTKVRIAGWWLELADLSWTGTRPIGVDDFGNIVEVPGAGGTNFTIEDGLSQTLNVTDSTTVQITGRPGSVVQTVFDTPNNLQVRIEWGSSGQVVWYDSDFWAAWQYVRWYDVEYDNTTSGLAALNIQSAIDEVVASIPNVGSIVKIPYTPTILTNSSNTPVTVLSSYYYDLGDEIEMFIHAQMPWVNEIPIISNLPASVNGYVMPYGYTQWSNGVNTETFIPVYLGGGANSIIIWKYGWPWTLADSVLVFKILYKK